MNLSGVTFRCTSPDQIPKQKTQESKMDSRYYPNVEVEIPRLNAELRNLFDSDYEVQTFQVSTTSIVQARKSNTLRDLTGLSSALTIKVTPEAGGTRVEIGMQKWFDKAAVAAVGAIVFAPL